MKTKTTKKEIIKNYKNVISVGYCSAWYLLKGQEARYYTKGVYGWNADIYQVNYNTVIVTGYRPFGEYSAVGVVDKYNEKAKNIYNSDLAYDKKIVKINKLLDNFINEVLGK
jgi:hypothetical protein